MQYSDAVAYLQSFPDMERGTHGPRGATMSLDSMKSLLKRLGDPHNGRHTAHITGSKGKGSTTEMMAHVLERAGYSTAKFTSPHLHSYTERIALGLKPVSEQVFADGIEYLMPFVKEEEEAGSTISTFGVLTALFFHLAREAKVDWQVVEVGLGGRFDATNVFERKELALITAISLEHIEILGTNQTEIATNKAGIITPGCVAVLAPQKDASVRSVISRRASEVGAEWIYVPKLYKIKSLTHEASGQTFSIEGGGVNMTLHTPMLGEHQISNAATVVAAAKVLKQRGFDISDAAITDGITGARIPGRFELKEVETAGGKTPVVLDGAHNHESAAGLASALKTLFPDRKCIFVIGVNVDKNVNAIWRELLPLCRIVIATRSNNPRAMDAHSLSDQISFQSSSTHLHSKSTDSVGEALDLAFSMAQKDDVICVTGSLYVVADSREHLKPAIASP